LPEKIMKCTKRKRKFLAVCGILLWLIAALWLVGAIESGLFIGEDDRPASTPNEESMDAFSRQKKFINVERWQVAYVDEGAGRSDCLVARMSVQRV